MASLTRWTWVWVNSGSWGWTGRPGVLRFMGSQRVGHDWATELNWTEPKIGVAVIQLHFFHVSLDIDSPTVQGSSFSHLLNLQSSNISYLLFICSPSSAIPTGSFCCSSLAASAFRAYTRHTPIFVPWHWLFSFAWNALLSGYLYTFFSFFCCCCSILSQWESVSLTLERRMCVCTHPLTHILVYL